MDTTTKLQDTVFSHIQKNPGCGFRSILTIPHTVDDLDFMSEVLEAISYLEKLGSVSSTTDQKAPYSVRFYSH